MWVYFVVIRGWELENLAPGTKKTSDLYLLYQNVRSTVSRNSPKKVNGPEETGFFLDNGSFRQTRRLLRCRYLRLIAILAKKKMQVEIRGALPAIVKSLSDPIKDRRCSN